MPKRRQVDIEDGCPIPDTHRRLASAHRLWHQTTKVYSNPDAFRTNLNSTIQELRNVTFILQKEQRKIPDFEAWYAQHQARMKSDPVMRWLVHMRNRIVKQGDLETNSRAVVQLVDAYFDRKADGFGVPPTAKPVEIATMFAARAPPWAGEGFIEVERRWEVSELPDRELLDALAECYATLATVVDDAHRAAGKPHQTQTCPSVRDAPPTPRGGIPVCMRVAREVRIARVELGTLNRTRIRRHRFAPSEKATEEARRRYGFPEDYAAAIRTGDYEMIARALHDVACTIIKKDPLVTAVTFFKEGRPVDFAMFMPADRTDKYQLFREMATHADASAADAVIVNAETWLYPRGPEGPRDEGVMTVYERCDGTGLVLTSTFKRQGSRIELSKAHEAREPGWFNTLEPTRAVWRRRGLRG